MKRNIPLKALQAGPVEDASKGTARQTITIVTGISDDTELDRMSDFELIGAVAPRGGGW